eukprot:GFUD01039775.1.p1 GENE.GFUD01039775.1~~GFUD01039775.1.p1  ORF type:complete len:209 (+),score=25.13 GFUD01039775.1:40-627(+)
MFQNDQVGIIYEYERLRDLVVAEKKIVFKSIFGYSLSPGKKSVLRKEQVHKKVAKSKELAVPTRSSSRVKPTVNYLELEAENRKRKTVLFPKAQSVTDDSKKDKLEFDKNSVFVCSICMLPFKFQNSLVKHIKANHELLEFCCDICNKTFNYKANLKRHVDVTHAESAVNFPCSLCSKVFMYNCTLKKHIKVQHM